MRNYILIQVFVVQLLAGCATIKSVQLTENLTASAAATTAATTAFTNAILAGSDVADAYDAAVTAAEEQARANLIDARAAAAAAADVRVVDTTDFDGLIYYMPKKAILLKVTMVGTQGQEVSSNIGLPFRFPSPNNGSSFQVANIELETTTAYPDLSMQFALMYGRNAFGKNSLDVGVNEKGLLTNASAIVESNVAEAFNNLATTAGRITAQGFDPSQPGVPPRVCESEGVHTFIIDPETDPLDLPSPCGLNITITRIGTGFGTNHNKTLGEDYPGIFYRHNEPYEIIVTSGGKTYTSIVLVPGKDVHFLPISRSFFADSKAEFEFKDGVPSSYKQDTDAEIVALAKLPADIISSYFAAIGSVFTAFQSNTTGETSVLSAETAALTAESASQVAELQLLLLQNKVDACRAAIEEDNTELLEKLNCGSVSAN